MRLFAFLFAFSFSFAQANEACFKAPTPVCVTELAFDAAQKESEGLALRELYETLIETDQDLARRETWLKKYEEFAIAKKNEELLERLPVIKAEHYARIKQFDSAYTALAQSKNKFNDSQILILDEARAGRIKEAVSRIDTNLDPAMRDDARLSLLLLALKNSDPLAVEIHKSLKEGNVKNVAQALFWAQKGELKTFLAAQKEWLKTVKTGQDYPFDTKENLTRETFNTYLQGAILAKNKDMFNEALAIRGAFSTSEETESVGIILTQLFSENLIDWVRLISVHIALPAGETIASDEESFTLTHLPNEKLKEAIEATQKIPAIHEKIIDLAIEAHLTRGQLEEAYKLFIDQKRVSMLNKGNYDENPATTAFESLAMTLLAKESPFFKELKTKVSVKEGKDYLTKLEQYAGQLKTLETTALKAEPDEETWSELIKFVMLTGKAEKMTRVISHIQTPELRAAAYGLLLRTLFKVN